MQPVSYFTLDEALEGLSFPNEVRHTLTLIDVEHVGFDDTIKKGQIIMHKELAEEVRSLFSEMVKLRFPIEKVVPIVAYGWDDLASMADNNSSGFNYREIMLTDRLSNHSFGRALDINPRLNPYLAYDKKIYPQGATYDLSVPGTLASDSPVTKLFKGLGWEWGGDWTEVVDYQHFQKL